MKEELKKDYIRYADVEAKEIEWLWFPYLPKGMVSIVQGDPKSGKTFMLIDIISRITRGDYMPLNGEKFEMGNVVLLNSDDPIEYSLKGRLELQNADTEKVFAIDENTKKLYFKDLSRLEKLIEEQKPILIVIDPIQAYMGDGDSNSMVQVRNALAPLKDKGEVNVNEVANQDSNTKFENAKNFILGCIASKGNISATELQQLCNIGGFSERTFNGARSYLNKNNKIHSIKKNGRTYWCLSSPLDDNVQSCNVESVVLEDDKI